jgi:F420-non-reducing hydrogenase iron-sulfur subunit
MVHNLMEQLGIEPQRLRLEWISAAEGEKFAKTIREMTTDLKKLGPSQVAKVLKETN